MIAVLGALIGTLGCGPDATTVADASMDGGLPIEDGSVDGGRGVVSWCGEADDLPCCEGSSPVPPDDLTTVPFVPPVFEPVRGVDDATRAFVDTGALDVAAIWRGVADSGDADRPSRVTLEVPSLGTLVFDFARAVTDFPALTDGAVLNVSAAAPANPYAPLWNEGRAVRLARPDGSLLAVAGTGCNIGGTGQLPALLAPFVGTPAERICREPAPVISGATWCYTGRTNNAIRLEGVTASIAPGDSARVSVGGAMYDFTNYRFAFSSNGGPHAGDTCAAWLPPLCAFGAYAVELP